jgi:hypothetical protein
MEERKKFGPKNFYDSRYEKLKKKIFLVVELLFLVVFCVNTVDPILRIMSKIFYSAGMQTSNLVI